ncbi:MAG: hypothetical protein ACYYK0_03650 [Candidatus Eutrophobiaceae bacterium]
MFGIRFCSVSAVIGLSVAVFTFAVSIRADEGGFDSRIDFRDYVYAYNGFLFEEFLPLSEVPESLGGRGGTFLNIFSVDGRVLQTSYARYSAHDCYLDENKNKEWHKGKGAIKLRVDVSESPIMRATRQKEYVLICGSGGVGGKWGAPNEIELYDSEVGIVDVITDAWLDKVSREEDGSYSITFHTRPSRFYSGRKMYRIKPSGTYNTFFSDLADEKTKSHYRQVHERFKTATVYKLATREWMLWQAWGEPVHNHTASERSVGGFVATVLRHAIETGDEEEYCLARKKLLDLLQAVNLMNSGAIGNDEVADTSRRRGAEYLQGFKDGRRKVLDELKTRQIGLLVRFTPALP